MPAKAPFQTQKQEKLLRALGQQIREQRKVLGLSAIATAEAAEMSRITLYRIEQGMPSVAIGAYLSAIEALGLKLILGQPQRSISSKLEGYKLPKKIRLADYPQLKRLGWQLKSSQELSPEEALDLYERNWRHLDLKTMNEKEKRLLQLLLATFGRERLLV